MFKFTTVGEMKKLLDEYGDDVKLAVMTHKKQGVSWVDYEFTLKKLDANVEPETLCIEIPLVN